MIIHFMDMITLISLMVYLETELQHMRLQNTGGNYINQEQPTGFQKKRVMVLLKDLLEEIFIRL